MGSVGDAYDNALGESFFVPGFRARSVWMTFSISRPVALRRERPMALITPAETVD